MVLAAALGCLLGVLAPLGFGVHLVEQGGELPEAEGLGVSPREPETVGHEGEVYDPSGSIGSGFDEVVLIFSAPASSNVKDGSSLRFEMKARAWSIRPFGLSS